MYSFTLWACIVAFLSRIRASAHRSNDGDRHHRRVLHHSHHPSHGLRSTQASSLNRSQELLFVDNGSRCGTIDPPKIWMKESLRIVKRWLSNKKLGLNQVSTVEIATYFHVISSGSASFIPDENFQRQLDVLNDAYSPHGFSFLLLNITRSNNSKWYSTYALTPEDEAMKTALRVGGASTLNVYFNNPYVLGYATFPEEYIEFPKLDGVVVSRRSIPGGQATGYNEGKTLVHEVGHWLGLYHTFQAEESVFDDMNIPFFSHFWNGCTTSGDGVYDTPAQKTPTYGCPTDKDTCFLKWGADPVHNFMDYSDDACYSEFTNGQAERMLAMWSEYRASR